MLEARPNEPTTTISFGFDISVGERVVGVGEKKKKRGRVPSTLKNLPTASKETEKQRARRKTPLMRAARISALCQP